jgi:hypothetical protein
VKSVSLRLIPQQPSDAALLADDAQFEARVLNEMPVPEDASVAAIAEMIQQEPLRFALRFVNLEAHVRMLTNGQHVRGVAR